MRAFNTHFVAKLIMMGMILPAMSACGTVLPSEGPSAAQIIEQRPEDSQAQGEYAIVPVSGPVIAAQLSFEPHGLRKVFGKGSPESFRNRIGVGDILRIDIWEAADDGLFSTADKKETRFPPMRVDKRGRITIPYVGVIRAAGLTPLQLQKRIERQLDGKAISPQVMVTIAKNVANSVVVNGDVRKPGRYEISLKGDHVLDILASAGGAAAPARETMLTLIRNGRRGIQSLKRIIRDPSENLYVRPGDQIYLSHNPQTYTAFGAVTKTGEYPFDSDRVNIIEAVARAGGLLDNRADAKGVFLFRIEDNRVLRAFHYDADKLNPSGKTPTVYVLDMSKPRAFFLAQGFMMQDNDVIYVANSAGAELQKFLKLLNAGTAALRGTYSMATIGN
jgi:polysaccharide export outer membrane protein